MKEFKEKDYEELIVYLTQNYEFMNEDIIPYMYKEGMTYQDMLGMWDQLIVEELQNAKQTRRKK